MKHVLIVIGAFKVCYVSELYGAERLIPLANHNNIAVLQVDHH